MSFTIIRKTKEKPEIKIADKNIVIYKIVGKMRKGLYFSPLHMKTYKLKQKNEREKLVMHCSKNKHSYYYEVNEGYCAYTKLETAKNNQRKFDFDNNSTILKGIIPKGEQYLANKADEIIASNIILIEECH